MNKTIVLLFLAVIAIPAALAANEFSVVISPDRLTIKDNETAAFDIAIQNNLQTSEYYNLFSPDINWDAWTEQPLLAKPGELFITKLYIRPIRQRLGLHNVVIAVKLANKNIVVEKNILLEIQSSTPPLMDYLPALIGQAIMPESIDPRNPVKINILLENRNRKNITKLILKARSNLINSDYTTSIGPLEKKNFTITAQLDSTTLPQTDALKITAIVEDSGKVYQFDIPAVKYEVLPYEELTPEVVVEKGFFSKKTKITLTNNGNTKLETEYKLPMPFFKRIFTMTDPNAERTKGNLVWNIRLKPGESTTLTATSNYLAIPILLLLIAAAIILHYVLRSPITIHKKAIVVGTHEGGISELKVFLNVTNRSSKKVKNVELIDVVPRIAEHIREEQIGTPKPFKTVRHEKIGTIMNWKLEDINAGDQRIITYKMKSGLSILGGVSLPVALARFETEAGTKRKTKSNVASIELS